MFDGMVDDVFAHQSKGRDDIGEHDLFYCGIDTSISKVHFSRLLTSQVYSISHREVISFDLHEIICNTFPPSISR